MPLESFGGADMLEDITVDVEDLPNCFTTMGLATIEAPIPRQVVTAVQTMMVRIYRMRFDMMTTDDLGDQ